MSALPRFSIDHPSDVVTAALRRRVSELRAIAFAASPLERFTISGEVMHLDTLRQSIELQEGRPEQLPYLEQARQALGLPPFRSRG